MTTWLRVVREPTVHEATMGALYINGHWQAWTLEDEIRDAKIAGVTAIPAGRYRIVLTPSQRFKRVLPLLLDVPGFEGIRIHPGNTSADTSGCLLVGNSRMSARLAGSRIAFELLFERLQAVTDPIWISVENPPVFETQVA